MQLRTGAKMELKLEDIFLSIDICIEDNAFFIPHENFCVDLAKVAGFIVHKNTFILNLFKIKEGVTVKSSKVLFSSGIDSLQVVDGFLLVNKLKVCPTKITTNLQISLFDENERR